MSVPPPAAAMSPRHVDPYMPWIGKYWSSRMTVASGRPYRPDAIASAAARYTGDQRSTSPTWCGTVASAAATRSQSANVGASGFSQKIGSPRADAASTAARCPAVHVHTHTTSTVSSNASSVGCGSPP